MYKNLNNIAIVLFIIIFISPIILFFIDYFDFGLKKLTVNYDWLAYIGAYFSAIATLILGMTSIKQNEALSKVNKKMLEDNLITTGYSKLDFENEQYIDKNKSDYGFKLKLNQNIEKEICEEVRFIFKIKDIENRPLQSFKINKMRIQYNYVENDYKNEITIDSTNNEYVNLEKSIDMDQETYYMPVIGLISNEISNNIKTNSYLRVTFDVSLKNSFNIVSESENTIIINKTNNENQWKIYKLVGRKIYYGKIYYNNF